MAKEPNVIVLGGAGYIGSHTCKALAAAGYRPVTFDDLSEGREEFVRWGPLIRGNILDQGAVSAAFAEVRPVACIHFAARAYVGESVADPGRYYRGNTMGALNVLDAARDAENGPVPLVFSSTCAVYGEPEVMPITEDTPPAPINPYGRSKRMVEQMLEDYGAAYGLPWMGLRYFNACGSDPEGETGEWHAVETRIVPRAIFSQQGRIDDFAVMGTDYDTPDGSAIRDYIHVTDLASAHVRAVGHLTGGGASGIVNLGTGVGISVLQILTELERLGGKPVPHLRGPRREGDPPVLVADPTRAQEVLGWVAEHSSIEAILRTGLDWHKRTAEWSKEWGGV